MSRPTLQRRLYALLFRWFLLVLALAGVAMVTSYGRIRDREVEERLLMARALTRQVDTAISEVFHSLRELASEPGFLAGEPVEQLRSCRFQHLFRDAVYVLDAGGEQVMSDPPLIAPLPAEYLRRRELVTPRLEKLDGRLYVAIVQPFTAGGQLHYLVSEMHLPSRALTSMLVDLSPSEALASFVIDGRAHLVAAPPERFTDRPVPASAELLASLGEREVFVELESACWGCEEAAADDPPEDEVTVASPLAYAPWAVVLQQPRSEVLAALVASRNVFLTTLGLLAVLVLTLTVGLSRVVVGPIKGLAEQAERLRAGELERPIAAPGDYEIELLAHSMDEARQKLVASLGELQELNETLEDKVARRTAEIRALLKKTLEKDAERRKLVRRLLGAGEEERRRIARELHDEISQLLTVVQLSLEELPRSSRELRKAQNLLVKTQKELHRLIYDLRPSLLDDLGLAAAVRWYAENDLAPHGVEVSLEIEEGLRLPPELEITVFRIYQEIVTNILRHAKAENVSIELYTTGAAEGGRLVLAVEDNGHGFEPGMKSGGAGIVGMHERADLVGGKLAIDSEPGLGTHVLAEFPLDTVEVSESEPAEEPS